MSLRHPRIAIVAYGSLIHQPGEELAELIAAREPCTTHFPVEYGRCSPKWGGGPVLTIDPRGGPVEGMRLLLHGGTPLGRAIDVLARREGIPGAEGIVELPEDGPVTALTCALPRNLDLDEMEPAVLAARALESVASGPANGVAYLRGAVASGVRTPRTDAYVAEVLAQSGAPDLATAGAC